MEHSRFNTALQVVVATTIVAGVGFILYQNVVVTIVGILAVIIGLMGLIPVVRFGLEELPAPP